MNTWQRFCRWILRILPARDEEVELVASIMLEISSGLNAEPNATDHGGWRHPVEIWRNRRTKRATCRHAATVLLDQMVSRSDIGGTVEYVAGQHQRVPEGTSFHAWVEWEHGESVWICDPYMQDRPWPESKLRGEYRGETHLPPRLVWERIRVADMASGRQGQ